MGAARAGSTSTSSGLTTSGSSKTAVGGAAAMREISAPFGLSLTHTCSAIGPDARAGGFSVGGRSGGYKGVRGDFFLHEPLSVCDGDRRCAAVDAELREHPLDVRCDGLRADDELEGDLALISTSREKSEDLPLSHGQRGERRAAVFARLLVTVAVAAIAA